MANPSQPKINFSAAFMAWYNNPKIAVLTLVTDDNHTVIDYPAYGKILRLLRSGRVPILLVTSASREDGQLLQLNAYSSSDRMRSFSSTYLESSVAGQVTEVVFRHGKPPVIHSFHLDKTNP